MKRIVLSLGLCIAALHLMAQRVNVELLYDQRYQPYGCIQGRK